MSDLLVSDISREAIHQRFNKEALEFVKKCFVYICQVKLGKKLNIEIFKNFNKILITDSTWWELAPKLKGIFPGNGGSSSKSQCKLQLMIDYCSGQIDSFELAPGIKADQTFRDLILKRLKKNSLLITDLGYFSFELFYKLKEMGAYFISRLRSNVNIYHPITQKKISTYHFLECLEEENIDTEVIIGVESPYETNVRLVAVKTPKEFVSKKEIRYIDDARRRKKRVTKETLELLQWNFLITNVPREILPAKSVLILYSIRWQIELIFKNLKSTFNIHNTTSSNIYRVLCEIYGRLIAAVLLAKVHSHLNYYLWEKERKELSFDKLSKRFQERAVLMLNLFFDSSNKVYSFFETFLKTSLKNCFKIKQRSRSSPLERLLFSSNQHFKYIPPCFTLQKILT